MDEIRKQVTRAQRRLVLQQFLGVVNWSLFACLLIAVAGIAVPRIWPIGFDIQTWDFRWLAGCAVAGVLLGIVWTYCVRRAALDAAIEIDRRYGLKERVSSFLALSPVEKESEIGRALMDDAVRRVTRIDVRDQFRVGLNRRCLWLLVPAIAAFATILFVPAAKEKQATAANSASEQSRKQVQKSAEELKKRIEQQREQAESKGLKEAESIFKKLTEGIDHLKDSQNLDRKNALVKLNNLADDLQKRRSELGSAEKMKEQLQQLKNMQSGPADKMLNAMKNGDFGKAMDQLNSLKDKIEKGEMSPEEKAQFAKQLENVQKKLEEMLAERDQAKQELQRQIQQKQQEGDLAAASKLQQQLDKLSKSDAQAERLSQMAQQMQQAADALKEGDPKAASQQLQKLASDMKQMQADMQEMESIDSVLDQIAEAKDSMNCEECDGGG